MAVKEAIEKIVKGSDLEEAQAYASFNEIMSGNATPAQIAALITALRVKGETVEEITGAAKVMREKSVRIECRAGCMNIDREEINIDEETILDTCGTGGSGTNTFNISTAVSFVVAGCGVKVAKHGNRSASSECGSADVLEALGVKIDANPDTVARSIREAGIGFMYAPLYHGAMKYALPVRKEIGIRTIFNILGPLSNPAGATHQVLGVYSRELTKTMALVLKNLGTRRALVVHGEDALDELTITGSTRVTELKDGAIRTYYVTPEKAGLARASLEDIKGGDAVMNAEIIRAVLAGERGPRRDIVVLNAGAALYCAGKATDLKKGSQIAARSIDSGRASGVLSVLIEYSRKNTDPGH